MRCNHNPLSKKTTLLPIRQLQLKKGEVRTEPNAICGECNLKARANLATGEIEIVEDKQQFMEKDNESL